MDEMTNKGNSKLGHGIVRTKIFGWFGVISLQAHAQSPARESSSWSQRRLRHAAYWRVLSKPDRANANLRIY
jgi:hypothetical protein